MIDTGTRNHAFVVERRSVEAVPLPDRHGRPVGQFALWLGTNLTIADFALGFLPVTLGVPWGWTIVAILVGNLLGGLALGAMAAIGPTYGLPQMVIARTVFGRLGGRLPAALNYISTLGWYTVNTILAALGIHLLVPALHFWEAALILVVVQTALAVYGHDLVHRFERLMSVALGALFVAVTVYVLSHGHHLSGYHGGVKQIWPAFAIVVAATLSYLGSWSPYGSDYSRYLPAETSRKAILGCALLGGFIASAWLELLGVAVAVLAGPHAADPTAAARSALGGLGDLAVVGIILGGIAANAVNAYSNSLSAAAVGVSAPRWSLAILAGVAGFVASVISSGHFEKDYENFLLLLGYWFTPWLAVQAVDFFFLRHRHGAARSARWLISPPAMIAFLVGIGAEIPFMSSDLYTGPVASSAGGADVSFYVGFVVAAVVYLAATAIARDRGATGTPLQADEPAGAAQARQRV